MFSSSLTFNFNSGDIHRTRVYKVIRSNQQSPTLNVNNWTIIWKLYGLVPRYLSNATSEGSRQTFRLELAACNSISLYMMLEWGTRAWSNIIACDTLLSRNLLSCCFQCVFHLRVNYLRVLFFVSLVIYYTCGWSVYRCVMLCYYLKFFVKFCA